MCILDFSINYFIYVFWQYLCTLLQCTSIFVSVLLLGLQILIWFIAVKYDTSDIEQLTSLLIESKVVQPVTFPVHAVIAANSVEVLSTLILTSVDGTTLTLWCGEEEKDLLSYQKLSDLIKTVGRERVRVMIFQW